MYSANTASLATSRHRSESHAGWLLLAAIAVSLMFAFDSVIGGVATTHMMGTTGATPDAIAWTNIAFVFAALMGFVVAADLSRRRGQRRLLLVATWLLGLSSVAAVGATQTGLLVLLRGVQGLSSGLLLAAVQAMLFERFSYRAQGLVQASFALGVVMTPNSLGPALEGWIADNLDWSWSFFVILPLALVAGTVFASMKKPAEADESIVDVDWIGIALLAGVMLPLTYILQRGDRFNWFDDSRICWLCVLVALQFVAFVAWLARDGKRARVIDITLFRDRYFAFGFAVSFVAGFALYGSALLIGALSTAVLGYTATDNGLLLLPSAITVGIGLFTAGVSMQFFAVSPVKLIPVGLILFLFAMWMFAHSTTGMAGASLMPAILVRGLGLGFLFVALTVSTFATLRGHGLYQGVGLFNAGRQLGGLIGTASVARWFHVERVWNFSDLTEDISVYNPHFLHAARHLVVTLSRHSSGNLRGMTTATVIHEVMRQAAVLSLDECFVDIVVVILCCVPLVIVLKLVLGKFAS